jgi:hypothetical protein
MKHKQVWAEPVHTPSIGAQAKNHDADRVLDLQPCSVSYEQLKPMTRKQRMQYIAAHFLASNASSFIRSMVAHRLIDHVFDAVVPNTMTSHVVRKSLHTFVNLNEVDTALQRTVTLYHDESPRMFNPEQEMRMLLDGVMQERFGISDPDSTEYSGGSYNNISFIDIASTLSNLQDSVAKDFDVHVLYKETIEDVTKVQHLFVVEHHKQDRYGVFIESKKSFMFDDVPLSCIRVTYDAGMSRHHSAFDTFIGMLTPVVRANFLAGLHPEKHIIELEAFRTRVVPRKQSFAVMPNINLPEITRGIKYALEHHKRYVIALIGDPGLGKTEAIHTIVNEFLNVPAYIVTPDATSGTNASAVTAIFDAVSRVESIVVFDDFEGHDVLDKNEVTIEFMRQLSGASGFNGVALIVANDPTLIHPQIIDRIGRVDAVYMIGYLTEPDHIRCVIQQHFPDLPELGDEYNTVFAVMVERRFNISRMIGAVSFMQTHYTVCPDGLTQAVDRMSDFQRIAGMRTRNGRLVELTPEELTADKKPKPQRTRKLRRRKMGSHCVGGGDDISDEDVPKHAVRR